MEWLWGTLTGVGFQLMAGMFAGVAILEAIRPVRRTRAYTTNTAYSVINGLAVAAIAPSVAAVTAVFTYGLVDLRDWDMPVVLVVLLSTAVWDFFYYWMHRLQHRSRWLWQEHLVHHSDRHVNVTTSGRTHILEQVLAPIFITIPIAALVALPPATIVAIALIPWGWAYFVHANVRIGFGPLWWLLASPQYHRIHHSLEPQHFDRNFVVWFPIWDILFGTAYRPTPGEYPDTGVEGVEVKTVHGLYLLPFKGWWAMIKHR